MAGQGDEGEASVSGKLCTHRDAQERQRFDVEGRETGVHRLPR